MDFVAESPEQIKVRRALRNYELYNKLPEGSATMEQVKATRPGVDGFANWKEG